MDSHSSGLSVSRDTTESGMVEVAGVQIAVWEPAQSGEPLLVLPSQPASDEDIPDVPSEDGDVSGRGSLLKRLRFDLIRRSDAEEVSDPGSGDLSAVEDDETVTSSESDADEAIDLVVEETFVFSSSEDDLPEAASSGSCEEPEEVTSTAETIPEPAPDPLPLPEPVPVIYAHPFSERMARRRELIGSGEPLVPSETWRVRYRGEVWRLSFLTGRWFRRTNDGWVESAPPERAA